MFDLNPRVNDLSGIKDIVGIKGLFQHAHQVQSILAMLALLRRRRSYTVTGVPLAVARRPRAVRFGRAAQLIFVERQAKREGQRGWQQATLQRNQFAALDLHQQRTGVAWAQPETRMTRVGIDWN